MRAWEISAPLGPAGLTLVDRPAIEPGPREALVRVRAVSLNHRDLLVIGGRYLRELPAATVPCSDAAGEVMAIGAEVTRVRVGDRVTSTFAPRWQDGPYSLEAAKSALGAGTTTGTLADTIVLAEDALVPMPAALTFEQAATLPCAALTAWHALFEEGAMPAGATVLTQGTGGVSIFAVQFAVLAGASVVATSSRDDKLARLGAMGAGTLVNYAEDEHWSERAKEATGGTGVDHVIEVGGEGTIEQSMKAVRFGGTITLIGALARNAQLQLTPVFMRNIRLQGIMVGSRAMFERMNTAIARSGLVPVVDTVFPFERAPEAFEYLAGATHFGKVVIAID